MIKLPVLAGGVTNGTGANGVTVGARVDVGNAVHVGVGVGWVDVGMMIGVTGVGVDVRVGVGGMRGVTLGVAVTTCVMAGIEVGVTVGLGDTITLGTTVAVGVGVIGISDNTSEAGGCSGLVSNNGTISSKMVCVDGIA